MGKSAVGKRRRKDLARAVPLLRTRAVLGAGTLLGVGWVGTYAAFTDDATADTGEFSTGSVDLVLADDTDDAYAFTALGLTDMTPGASVYALLPVENAGSLGFQYGMTTTATGDTSLADELDVGVRVIAGETCDASAYAGGVDVVADSTTLSAASMSGRSLAAGVAENLCFHVSLPAAASNDVQGLSTSATFTFVATQT